MDEDLRKYVQHRVRLFRGLLTRMAADPAALDEEVLSALHDARTRHDREGDAHADPVFSRARRALRASFDELRGAGALVPLAWVPARVRARTQRARTHLSPVFVSTGPLALDSVSSFVAAVAFAVAAATGMAHPAIQQQRHELTASATGRVEPAGSSSRTNPVQQDPPTTSGLGTTISTQPLFGRGPAGAQGRAGIGSDDRIVVAHQFDVSVGEHEVISHNDAPIYWFSCDPSSTVRRSVCANYRLVEHESKAMLRTLDADGDRK